MSYYRVPFSKLRCSEFRCPNLCSGHQNLYFKCLNRLQVIPMDIKQVGHQNLYFNRQVTNSIQEATKTFQFKISSSRKVSRRDNSFYLALFNARTLEVQFSSGTKMFYLKYYARGNVTGFECGMPFYTIVYEFVYLSM